MTLALRTSLIKESPTFAILTKASKMKKEGHNVIILAAGEPDFDTPHHIKDAAIKAINEGKTKYTPVSGIMELKQAVIDKFRKENNLNYSLNEVIVSAGGKHSIYNALQALINEKDEVIIPAPYWVSYPDMVLLSGGTPVFVECSIENNYKLTPEKLTNSITKHTKAIFLNSPNNPTGMVYSEQELLALAAELLKHPQIYIISDDIYEHIIFEDKPFKNILNVCPELKNRVVVINGVSKAYSMTGWRIGFTGCNDKSIIKAMESIQSQSTSNPSSISQYAALAALNGGHSSLSHMTKELQERSNFVINKLNEIKGLRCLKTQGAFYAFFECKEALENLYNAKKITNKTDLALANYLLEDFLVACVPGSAFGLENHMRISFATSIKELTEALSRIKHALN